MFVRPQIFAAWFDDEEMPTFIQYSLADKYEQWGPESLKNFVQNRPWVEGVKKTCVYCVIAVVIWQWGLTFSQSWREIFSVSLSWQLCWCRRRRRLPRYWSGDCLCVVMSNGVDQSCLLFVVDSPNVLLHHSNRSCDTLAWNIRSQRLMVTSKLLRLRHVVVNFGPPHCTVIFRVWKPAYSTLSNPVPWQNWMAAYLGYTLRMKTLFRGWPVMAHDTHTRRRRRRLE